MPFFWFFLIKKSFKTDASIFQKDSKKKINEIYIKCSTLMNYRINKNEININGFFHSNFMTLWRLMFTLKCVFYDVDFSFADGKTIFLGISFFAGLCSCHNLTKKMLFSLNLNKIFVSYRVACSNFKISIPFD